MIALAPKQFAPHWVQCADCKGWFDPNEDIAVTLSVGFDTKTICINCADGIACKECGKVAELVDGKFCEDCTSWHCCECCNNWTHPDDSMTGLNDMAYCTDCFCDYFGFCSECGDCFYLEDLQEHEGEMYCEGCHPSKENFDPAGFYNRSGCTTKMGSERCYGLELETERCDNYNDLNGNKAWGAKDDATVSGKEFYSDILDGDEGLAAIADLVKLADSNYWAVDDDCGYHLHLDMRTESNDSLFAAAYAYRMTQGVWYHFVDESRHNGTYSHRACWTCTDLLDYNGPFHRFINSETRDRYEWLNLRAYSRHSTFEVRLHHASLNEKEICNWIKAHTRFVDWATTIGLDKVVGKLSGKSCREMFEIIAREAWRDSELRAFYAGKAGYDETDS